MADFRMPALGADMDEGTLVEWLVKPGDEVRKGEVIAVVDTDKAAIEVESFATGTVERLIVEPGRTVPVGTVLATIADRAFAEDAAEHRPVAQPASPLIRHLAAERGVDLAKVPGSGHGGVITRADVERAAPQVPPDHQRGEPQPPSPQPAPTSQAPARRPRVTPYARRIAAELNVDLARVSGTGPDGTVRSADVRRVVAAGAAERGEPVPEQAAPVSLAASQPEAVKPSETIKTGAERLLAMRRATARLMARSKREIPHYYLTNTVDLSAAMAWLHDRNRELEVADRLVPAALLLKAAAVAAKRVPQLNGFWADDQFVPASAVHLGVAISLRGGGLVTPAIRDATELSPSELMTKLRDLVTRARAGRLRGSELTDATITVTNLGDQGVESVHGVIYPPQVALVGFGKVAERPVAIDGLVGARPVVITTLAADHRATDGYTGARYLTALSDLLRQPEEL